MTPTKAGQPSQNQMRNKRIVAWRECGLSRSSVGREIAQLGLNPDDRQPAQPDKHIERERKTIQGSHSE